MIGHIYKIYSTEGPDFYIGGTTLPLNKRFNLHKYSSGKSQTKSVIIFQKYSINSIKIELIKSYDVIDNTHLSAYECLHLHRFLHNKTLSTYCVNKNHPFERKLAASRKQLAADYYRKNIDKLRERNLNYYYTNRDEILGKMSEYYAENKDACKDRAIEYYNKNRDKIQKYALSYYHKNKAAISERRKELYRQKKRK